MVQFDESKRGIEVLRLEGVGTPDSASGAANGEGPSNIDARDGGTTLAPFGDPDRQPIAADRQVPTGPAEMSDDMLTQHAEPEPERASERSDRLEPERLAEVAEAPQKRPKPKSPYSLRGCYNGDCPE